MIHVCLFVCFGFWRGVGGGGEVICLSLFGVLTNNG